MAPGNRGDIGKDQDGNPDGSWWGTNAAPNQHGGEHVVMYAESGHISYDTDSSGGYIQGSGHETDSQGNVVNDWDK